MIVNILGVAIQDTTRNNLKKIINKTLQTKQKLFLVSANSELLANSYRDKQLKEILAQSFCFPESIGLKLAYHKFSEITPGVELAEDILAGNLATKDYKVYLYGAKPKIVAKVAAKYPLVVGYCDGYFAEKSESTMLEEIRELQPDIVLVALGGGIQERWIASHLAKLPVQIMMGVGGSFDVLSGSVKRAPLFFRKLGLEWFYRLLMGFRWRRALNLLRFLLLILVKRVNVCT